MSTRELAYPHEISEKHEKNAITGAGLAGSSFGLNLQPCSCPGPIGNNRGMVEGLKAFFQGCLLILRKSNLGFGLGGLGRCQFALSRLLLLTLGGHQVCLFFWLLGLGGTFFGCRRCNIIFRLNLRFCLLCVRCLSLAAGWC